MKSKDEDNQDVYVEMQKIDGNQDLFVDTYKTIQNLLLQANWVFSNLY